MYYILCLFIGIVIGVLVTSLCTVSKLSDINSYEMIEKELRYNKYE